MKDIKYIINIDKGKTIQLSVIDTNTVQPLKYTKELELEVISNKEQDNILTWMDEEDLYYLIEYLRACYKYIKDFNLKQVEL